jgi:phospholipid/cholesterol/gamma-HCH transport system substrate-binding protein
VKRLLAAGCAALVLAVTTACHVPTVGELPLPGGAAGGPSYHVVVEFEDVLDLVPHSSVKVNDVTVGEVEKISLVGWVAQVRVRILDSTHLPDNAVAAIRQTSLLGEKFVSLAAPSDQAPTGQLAEGDVIPLSRTRRAAEVEEVLAAFGTLLNGGSLTNLQVITHELARALAGNESTAKDLLHQVDVFLAGLDASRAQIGQAIDALDRLLAKLSAQKEVLGQALDAFGPGLTVLADQRAQLTTALVALDKLGAVGTRVITASRDDLLSILASLQPTLDGLTKAGANLPKALDSLFTLVFPPNITNDIRNGFINLNVNVATGNGRYNNPPVLVRGGLRELLTEGVRA